MFSAECDRRVLLVVPPTVCTHLPAIFPPFLTTPNRSTCFRLRGVWLRVYLGRRGGVLELPRAKGKLRMKGNLMSTFFIAFARKL